jgi:hypothetical protein
VRPVSEIPTKLELPKIITEEDYNEEEDDEDEDDPEESNTMDVDNKQNGELGPVVPKEGLVTLSELPKVKWQSLYNLETIKVLFR